MPLHVSGVTRPSAGGSARMIFGVITCVECVLTECRLRFNRYRHVINTHPTHVITPNAKRADPPADGRVTPETCRGIDS
jgi:hypothetical protein